MYAGGLQGFFAFSSDGKKECRAGDFEELFRKCEAVREFFVRRGAIREGCVFFVRMEGENIPEKEIFWGEAGLRGAFPDDGIGRLVETFRSLFIVREERGIGAARAAAFFSQYHFGGNGGVTGKEHALAGHGDSGETAALVPAGFGDEKNARRPDAPGEIRSQIVAPDFGRAVDIERRILIPPRIADERRVIRDER